MASLLKESTQVFRSGHWPSLFGASLHFQVSCMVWLLIGALGVAIAEEFSLTATEKGLLVGAPLLGGALLRIVVGPLADHVGPKLVGLWLLGLESLGLILAWLGSMTFFSMLGIGLVLGVAGASFAIALPIASQAYPPIHQGFAMGVAGIGNSGVLLITFIAPRFAQSVGWHNTFGLMIIPVLLTAIIFGLVVQPDKIKREGGKRQGSLFLLIQSVVRQKFMYWLCFLYAVTFGGFVGLSSFLPIFLHDQYRLDIVTAGTLTAICGLAGSLTRPIGGHLADRFGGTLLLQAVFPLIAFMTLALGQLFLLEWAFPLIIITFCLLGFGNGVVFQVASVRFREVMGTAAGIIGAAGGLGGFLLPSWFGFLKDVLGTFSGGFWVLGIFSVVAGLSVIVVQRSFSLSVQRSI